MAFPKFQFLKLLIGKNHPDFRDLEDHPLPLLQSGTWGSAKLTVTWIVKDQNLYFNKSEIKLQVNEHKIKDCNIIHAFSDDSK